MKKNDCGTCRGHCTLPRGKRGIISTAMTGLRGQVLGSYFWYKEIVLEHTAAKHLR